MKKKVIRINPRKLRNTNLRRNYWDYRDKRFRRYGVPLLLLSAPVIPFIRPFGRFNFHESRLFPGTLHNQVDFSAVFRPKV